METADFFKSADLKNILNKIYLGIIFFSLSISILSCSDSPIEGYVSRSETPIIVYLRTTGNDGTAVINDSSFPYLTAQAAVDAALAYQALNDKPIVFDVGAGSFGDITLTEDFNGDFTWVGTGVATSSIGNFIASGANASVAGPAQPGFDITITSSDITFGNITSSGGTWACGIGPANYYGNDGGTIIISENAVVGDITANGTNSDGNGHIGNAGNVTVAGTADDIEAISGEFENGVCMDQVGDTAGEGGNGGIVIVAATGTVDEIRASNGFVGFNYSPTVDVYVGIAPTVTVIGTAGDIDARSNNVWLANGCPDDNCTVNVDIQGTAGNIDASGAWYEGGTVIVSGTAGDINVGGNGIYTDDNDGLGGYVTVEVAGVVGHVYANGGNYPLNANTGGTVVINGQALSVTANGGNGNINQLFGQCGGGGDGGVITVNGIVTGTVTANGGLDNDPAASGDCGSGGDGGYITVNTGASTGDLEANGGNSLEFTGFTIDGGGDGGDGGTIDYSLTATTGTKTADYGLGGVNDGDVGSINTIP